MSEPTEQSSQRHAFTTDAERWNRHLKAYSRANRKQPTAAEQVLWQMLRNSSSGYRFRRQHAIDRYIVDFVCLRAWLVVEVDGAVHAEAGQAEYDQGRTHALQELGFRVLRFSNHEVLHQPDHVLEVIRHCVTRTSPPGPLSLGRGGA